MIRRTGKCRGENSIPVHSSFSKLRSEHNMGNNPRASPPPYLLSKDSKRKVSKSCQGVSFTREVSGRREEEILLNTTNPQILPHFTPLQETKDWKCTSNQNKISLCLSRILSPCFVFASLSLQRSGFIETSQGGKNQQLSPRQWSCLHTGISNGGRRQATKPAEFSTCCYSSRKNVIQAALLRAISKSLQLPKRTLTLRCPLLGVESPGKTLTFGLGTGYGSPSIHSLHPCIHPISLHSDSLVLAPRFSVVNNAAVALGNEQEEE